MEKSVRDGIEYTLATPPDLLGVVKDLTIQNMPWQGPLTAFERKTQQAELNRLEAPDCALARRIIEQGLPPNPPIPALYGVQARLTELLDVLSGYDITTRFVLIDLDANPVDPLSFLLLHAGQFREGRTWLLPCQS